MSYLLGGKEVVSKDPVRKSAPDDPVIGRRITGGGTARTNVSKPPKKPGREITGKSSSVWPWLLGAAAIGVTVVVATR